MRAVSLENVCSYNAKLSDAISSGSLVMTRDCFFPERIEGEYSRLRHKRNVRGLKKLTEANVE